jgi:hypothetical protein
MPFPKDGGDGPKPDSAAYDAPPRFSPYDPPADPTETVQPNPPSPTPSSEAPGLGSTSGEDGHTESEEKPEPEPLPEFDPRHAEAFTGLLYLGRLQETFSLWGHTFVIRTLTTQQLAEISLIVKPYLGTFSESLVYQTAFVAAAVMTVDGQELPRSIMNSDEGELTTTRYPYVRDKWMPGVREQVYNRVYALELQSREVLAAMGKASG